METFEPTSAQEVVSGAAEEGKTGNDVADRIEREAESVEAQVAETMREAASDIREIVGGRNIGEFEGNQVGEAVQGEKGSSKIDVASTVKEGGDVDTTQLKDIVAHEAEHEEQAPQWNAEVVTMEDGQNVTREEVSEVGAMSVQKTLANVSGDYKEKVRKVTRYIPMEKARDVARSGDLLSIAA